MGSPGTLLMPAGVPYLARANYAQELQHQLMWAVLVGMVEGNLSALVAKQTFGANEFLASLLWASPILFNVLNVGWAIFLRGRPAIRSYLVLGGVAAVSVGSIGMLRVDLPGAPWLFALQLAGAHLCLSGLLTVRTSIWQANYPAVTRGRITGRMEQLRFLIIPATGLTATLLFEWNPQIYRLAYPAAGLVGLVSLWPMRRVRVRRERLTRREVRARLAAEAERSGGGLWSGLREAGQILREDRRFAGYMLAQFCLGAANFTNDPILINILVDDLQLGYFGSHLLMLHIPTALMLMTLPIWASYFDRRGVLQFRVINSYFWVASYVCTLVAVGLIAQSGAGVGLAAMIVPLGFLGVGRLFNGICRGGGKIAWQLGHMHFAKDQHRAGIYLGIHVGLTGLRGAVMPLVGVSLNKLVGWYSFFLPVALAVTALLLFQRLARHEREDQAREADRLAEKTQTASVTGPEPVTAKIGTRG